MTRMAKKTVMLKTVQTGISILFSRIFGFVRQVLQAHYLGVGVISDGFLTAFRIPNSLRKIFAEGALSAVLVPAIVHTVKKDGTQEVSRLITLSLLVIETLLLGVCLSIWLGADTVISFASPGFSAAQHAAAVPLLRALIGFIMFVSSSAVLAGGLQAVNHFFIPASSQVVLNMVYIGVLAVCLRYGLPVHVVAWGILLGGLVQFLLHLAAYWAAGLRFLLPHAHTVVIFVSMLHKFFMCLIAVSIMEIHLFIDGQFASYLPAGSVTSITYATDFMRIPLGIFAVAFSTILLSHISRVARYAPRRLSFYLHESLKLIIWVTVPAALIMSFFSYDIFYTVYHSHKFTLHDVERVSILLRVALAGLIFFSINKILLNFYYALQATVIPTVISIAATVVNIVFNSILMKPLGASGLVLATGIAALFQVVVSVIVLQRIFHLTVYRKHLVQFFVKFSRQLLVVSILFLALYYGAITAIVHFLPQYVHLLLYTVALWVWVAPICGILFLVLYFTRNYFGVSLHFLR